MLTKADIEKLGVLARIRLTEAEKDGLTTDLNKIVDFVDELQGADVGKEAANYLTIEADSLRADEVVESGIGVKDIETIAPQIIDNQLVVPTVLDKEQS